MRGNALFLPRLTGEVSAPYADGRVIGANLSDLLPTEAGEEEKT